MADATLTTTPTTTRTTFFDNGDLRYHAQVTALDAPTPGYALTITSQRRAARKPQEEFVKFMACLSREELLQVSRLIERAVG